MFGEGDYTEKAYYIQGKIYDSLLQKVKYQKADAILMQAPSSKVDIRKIQSNCVKYYLESAKKGNEYLLQTLPRALEIWFAFAGADRKLDEKVDEILSSIPVYKIAQVIEMLMSR
jgi:hypothetical protein